jgi:hypothetical protein
MSSTATVLPGATSHVQGADKVHVVDSEGRQTVQGPALRRPAPWSSESGHGCTCIVSAST